MTAPALAFLWDHCVARRALLAAAAMLEMAVAGSHAMLEGRADRTPTLEHVSFSRPVVLTETRSRCEQPPHMHDVRGSQMWLESLLCCAAEHLLPSTALWTSSPAT